MDIAFKMLKNGFLNLSFFLYMALYVNISICYYNVNKQASPFKEVIATLYQFSLAWRAVHSHPSVSISFGKNILSANTFFDWQISRNLLKILISNLKI